MLTAMDGLRARIDISLSRHIQKQDKSSVLSISEMHIHQLKLGSGVVYVSSAVAIIQQNLPDTSRVMQDCEYEPWSSNVQSLMPLWLNVHPGRLAREVEGYGQGSFGMYMHSYIAHYVLGSPYRHDLTGIHDPGCQLTLRDLRSGFMPTRARAVPLPYLCLDRAVPMRAFMSSAVSIEHTPAPF